MGKEEAMMMEEELGPLGAVKPGVEEGWRVKMLESTPVRMLELEYEVKGIWTRVVGMKVLVRSVVEV